MGRGLNGPVALWIGELARISAGFLVLRQLAHLVGPQVLGTYLAIISVAIIVPRLLDAGLPQALAFFLRFEVEVGPPLGRVLLTHAAVAAAAGCAVAWAMRAFPFGDAAVPDVVRQGWPWIAALVASELTALLLLSTFIPTNRYLAHALSQATPPCVLLLLVLGATAVHWTPDAGQLLRLYGAASLVGLAVTALSFLRQVRRSQGKAMDRRRLYRYGLHAYGTGVAKALALRLDRLLLATLLGSVGYAQYSLAVSIRDFGTLPATLHATQLRNRQIDLITRDGNLAEARRLLARGCGAWFCGAAVASACLYPVWPWLVDVVFGHRFAEAAHFLQLLAFSSAPIAVLGITWNHLYALGRPGRVTTLNVASLAIALPAFAGSVAWLGPTTGASVGAIAWALSVALSSFATAACSAPSVSVPTAAPR